nr:MAG TPA: hypothetical protein [Caudoviricetes sp.]
MVVVIAPLHRFINRLEGMGNHPFSFINTNM